MSSIIHFNNAGASLIERDVLDSQIAFLEAEYNEGAYEALHNRMDELQGTYDSLATLLNCSSDEIAITDSATRAWDLIFYSFEFQEGDIILCSHVEYGANLIPLIQITSKTKAKIIPIPTLGGDIDLIEMNRIVSENDIGNGNNRIKLITITHIPTNGGLINDAEGIGEIASKYKIPYLLDACQSVGQIPVDVKKIKCDFLTSTSRKWLRGPRGVGFLYAKKDFQYGGNSRINEPIFLDICSATTNASIDKDGNGGAYIVNNTAKRYETYEKNFAGVIGLGLAVRKVLDKGIHQISSEIIEIANYLRNELKNIDFIQVHDQGNNLGGIVCFSIMNIDSKNVKEYFSKTNPIVNLHVSFPSSTPTDANWRKLPPMVRASPSYYNSKEEVNTFIRLLKEYYSSQK